MNVSQTKNPSMRKTWVVFFHILLVSLSGCGRKPLEEAILGRWSETKEQRLYEFSSSGLYGVASNDEAVEIGEWSAKDGVVTMKSIVGPKEARTETWKVTMSDESFDIAVNDAFYRRFEKSEDDSPPTDKRLVGLWRKDGKYANVFNFTDHGGVLGVMWRREKDRSLVLMGLFGRVRGGTGEFTINGSMGTKTMLPVKHRYSMENDKLLWKGPKSEPEVFRRVQVQDLSFSLPK